MDEKRKQYYIDYFLSLAKEMQEAEDMMEDAVIVPAPWLTATVAQIKDLLEDWDEDTSMFEKPMLYEIVDGQPKAYGREPRPINKMKIIRGDKNER